jgi:hypothetical protein
MANLIHWTTELRNNNAPLFQSNSKLPHKRVRSVLVIVAFMGNYHECDYSECADKTGCCISTIAPYQFTVIVPIIVLG